MKYYQFVHKRATKIFGEPSKTCAAKNQRLEAGELFITYTDGVVEAVEAKVCPFCGAIFSTRYLDPELIKVENAHFLKTDS